MLTFEFDEVKSAANLLKHKIDFLEAQRLWEDPNLLEIPAKTIDEPRSLVLGVINGKYWSAVVTQRPPNIRIISVRPSRKEEVELYEG